MRACELSTPLFSLSFFSLDALEEGRVIVQVVKIRVFEEMV
jgi:hypothetical protein